MKISILDKKFEIQHLVIIYATFDDLKVSVLKKSSKNSKTTTDRGLFQKSQDLRPWTKFSMGGTKNFQDGGSRP